MDEALGKWLSSTHTVPLDPHQLYKARTVLRPTL